MSIFYQNRPERIRLFLSDNNRYAAHLHRQVELLVVLSGELELTVDHSRHLLHPDQGALIFPNQPHSLYTPQASRILLCIFEADVCTGYCKLFQDKYPLCSSFLVSEMSVHAQTAVGGLLHLAQDFPGEKSPSPDMYGFCGGYLMLLLTDFFTRQPLEDKRTPEDLDLEQRLLIYLDTHFTEELSLEILSRSFGISRFRLSRIFSDRLHTSFSCYVNSRRLEYARNQLLYTHTPITQIALDAGFGSTRTFFREFRLLYHVSPGEYRRQHPSSPA